MLLLIAACSDCGNDCIRYRSVLGDGLAYGNCKFIAVLRTTRTLSRQRRLNRRRRRRRDDNGVDSHTPNNCKNNKPTKTPFRKPLPLKCNAKGKQKGAAVCEKPFATSKKRRTTAFYVLHLNRVLIRPADLPFLPSIFVIDSSIHSRAHTRVCTCVPCMCADIVE